MDPSRHNMYCPLDLPKKMRHRVFTSMIKLLCECPLMHVISANLTINSGRIEEIWKKAKTDKNGDVISSIVVGKKLKITEADICRTLNIKDVPDHFYGQEKLRDLEEFVINFGYDVV